jgi:hypothetical protein
MTQIRSLVGVLLLLSATTPAWADAGPPPLPSPNWSTVSVVPSVFAGLAFSAAAIFAGFWAFKYPLTASGVVLVIVALPVGLIALVLLLLESAWGLAALALAIAALAGGVVLLFRSGLVGFGRWGILFFLGGAALLATGVTILVASVEWETPPRPGQFKAGKANK